MTYSPNNCLKSYGRRADDSGMTYNDDAPDAVTLRDTAAHLLRRGWTPADTADALCSLGATPSDALFCTRWARLLRIEADGRY